MLLSALGVLASFELQLVSNRNIGYVAYCTISIICCDFLKKFKALYNRHRHLFELLALCLVAIFLAGLGSSIGISVSLSLMYIIEQHNFSKIFAFVYPPLLFSMFYIYI
eukprot:SAG31_NODE_7540_length_1660_cov_1.057655_2_plen_109_part_00